MIMYPLRDIDDRSRSETESQYAVRQRLIVSWLIEFRFTTWPVAIELLGLQKSNGYRFLQKLQRAGDIEPVQGNLGDRLMVLTRQGFKNAVRGSYAPPGRTRTTKRQLQGSVQLHHDINVQLAAIRRMRGSEQTIVSVSGTGKLGDTKQALRPDALIKYAAEYCESAAEEEYYAVIEAIEFERTAKSRGRVYGMLGAYHRAMKDGLCNRVLLTFNDESVRNFYNSAMIEDEWPVVVKTKPGQVKKTGHSYKPNRYIYDSIHPVMIEEMGVEEDFKVYRTNMGGWTEPLDWDNDQDEEYEEEGGWDESNEPERRAAAPPVTVQIDAEPVAEEPTEGADQATADQPTSTGWRSFFRR